MSINQAGRAGCRTHLISRRQQLVSHLFQLRRLARVYELQHFFHNFVLHVCDVDSVLFLFLHLMFEHGGENWRSGGQNGFMGIEIFAPDGQDDVAELLAFKELTQVFTQTALGNFELSRVVLAGDVDGVGHDAYLQIKRNGYKSPIFWDAARSR